MTLNLKDYVTLVIVTIVIFTAGRVIYQGLNGPSAGQFWIGNQHCEGVGDLKLGLEKNVYALGERLSGIVSFTYNGSAPMLSDIYVKLLLRNESTDMFMIVAEETRTENISGNLTLNLTEVFFDEILTLGEWRVHTNIETEECMWIQGNNFSVVPEKPDLILKNVSMNSTNAAVGDTLSVTVDIENTGGSDSGEFFVRIYDDQTVLRDILVENLVANATTTSTSDWIPSTPGIHTISAYADYYDFVQEQNEWDNMRTTVVYVG